VELGAESLFYAASVEKKLSFPLFGQRVRIADMFGRKLFQADSRERSFFQGTTAAGTVYKNARAQDCENGDWHRLCDFLSRHRLLCDKHDSWAGDLIDMSGILDGLNANGELTGKPLVLGGVLLQSKLGEGGGGWVYKGYHTRLNIPVAVKVLKQPSPDGVASFLREARITVSIEHPNLVRVYDVDSDRITGLHYIVMEFIEGCSAFDMVNTTLANTGRPPDELAALQIMLAAARAISAAHKQGIVHRDLKPDNILIRNHDGVVKVTDLGLAGTYSHARSRTRHTSLVGTLGFLAPEVLSGAPASPASDIYSLGVTLYEIITGAQPFGEINNDNYLIPVTAATPDPRKHFPDLRHQTAELIMRCMDLDDQRRPQSGLELAEELENIICLIASKAKAPAAASKVNLEALKALPKILVVDDDPLTLDLMQEALQNNGFEAVCFSRPTDVLERIETIKPSAAIVDLQMPRIDGILLCQLLRQTPGNQDLPVLMLSGNDQASSISAAMRQGIDDYLLKPVVIQDLILRVRLLCELRNTNRQRQMLETQWQKIKKVTSSNISCLI
jgi:serine/threonine protein kinase